MRNEQAERPFRALSAKMCLLAVVTLAAWTFLLLVYSVDRVRDSWPDQLFNTDFVSFWTGASLVRDQAGPALYDMELQRRFQVQLRDDLATSEEFRRMVGHNPYHNPAPLSLLLLPLTLLPMPSAYLVWCAVSLATFIVALNLHLRRLRRQAVVMLMVPGGVLSVLEGQVNGMFALCLSFGLLCLVRDRPFVGGLSLGLMWLKPQYALVIALVLLAKARWLELAGMIVTGAVMAALFWLITGLEGIQHYLVVLNRIGEFHPPAASLIHAEAMVNWRGLLLNLFPGLPNPWGNALIVLLAGTTVALLIPVWRGGWDPRSPRFPVQMMATIMATLIAVPHSHFHGTVLLLPAVAMVVSRWAEVRALLGEWLITYALVGYLLSLLAWPARELSWLLVPYFLVFIALVPVFPRRGNAVEVALPEEPVSVAVS